MYLRTKFAWYILRRPSTVYAPYYRQAWTLHHVVQGLLSTVNADYRASASDILCSLNSPPTDDDPLRPSYDNFAVRFEERDLTTDAVVSFYLLNLLKFSLVPRFHIYYMYSTRSTMIIRPSIGGCSTLKSCRLCTPASPSANLICLSNAPSVPGIPRTSRRLFFNTETRHVLHLVCEPSPRSCSSRRCELQKSHRYLKRRLARNVQAECITQIPCRSNGSITR